MAEVVATTVSTNTDPFEAGMKRVTEMADAYSARLEEKFRATALQPERHLQAVAEAMERAEQRVMDRVAEGAARMNEVASRAVRAAAVSNGAGADDGDGIGGVVPITP